MLQSTYKILLVVASLLLFTSSGVTAAGRYALVIGNSAYTGGAPLKNPKNDAELIAKTLTEIGFEVIKVTDANQREMRRSMLAFSRKLRNNEGSVGLFYYAGHGVQVRGINYMVPVTADIKDEEEVRFEGVDVNDFLATMRSSNSRLNIIILDACRNNPFARSFRSASRGLAPVQAASGTLIAYSTAPGDVAFDGNGLNSPYTLALSRFIRKRGLPVETVFKRVLAEVEDATEQKQTPWLTGAFRGDFYFVSKEPSDNTPKDVSGSDGASPESLEKLFWQSIHTSSNPASFEAYLTAFPSGVFSPLAKIKIAELKKASKNTVVAAATVESSSENGRSLGKEEEQDRLTSSRLKGQPGSLPNPVPTNRPVAGGDGKETTTLAYRAVFPNSSKVSLKRAEVEKLSCHKLWLARNEIFYRNGYCFKSEKGIRYFDNSNCVSSVVKLSSLELRNKRTIRTWEIRKRCRPNLAANFQEQ
jgi:uncharacterized caspase-like protein